MQLKSLISESILLLDLYAYYPQTKFNSYQLVFLLQNSASLSIYHYVKHKLKENGEEIERKWIKKRERMVGHEKCERILETEVMLMSFSK